MPSELSSAEKRALAGIVVQLRGDDLREALATLRHKMDHRFIDIWRFRGGKAIAVVHYDRENSEALSATEVSDTAT